MWFLIDAICSYKSTEPIWFRFFRGVFSIILTAIFIYYSVYQFKQLNTETSIITFYDPFEGFELNMTMCTGISNEIESNVMKSVFGMDQSFNITNPTSYCQNVILQYNSAYATYEPFWLDINIIATNNDAMPEISYKRMLGYYKYPHDFLPPVSIYDNLLLLSFESFQFYYDHEKKDYGKFDKNLRRESIQSNYYVSLKSNYFLLYPGQTFFITLDPIITSKYSYSSEYYRSFRLLKLELNPQLEQLPVKLESNRIQFGISPRSNTYKTEEVEEYNYTSLISNLGGFYSAIAGIFYLIFGSPKLEPWGLAQKNILSCIPCRKSFTRNLARKYVTTAGIPLAEKVKQSLVEERLQILETLLQDYYLDNYYLEKMKEIKIQQRLLKNYNKLGQNNENTVPLILPNNNNNNN